MTTRTGHWMALCLGLAAAGCGDDAASTLESDQSATPDGGSETAEQDAGSVSRGPCGIDSGWAGDELCLKAPAADEGFQLHFGPADYDDPEEVARYVLMPGEEKLLCAYTTTPNDVEVFYDDWLNSLRPGSHHMIVNLVQASVVEAGGVPCEQTAGVSGLGLLGGNTTALAPFEETAPENEGLVRAVPAHVGIEMQMHFFNVGDEPLLMEAWQNIYYKDPAEVRETAAPIEAIAGLGMAVQPGTTEVIAGSIVAPSALRIVDMYSHNHDHTLRFSAYLRRAGEQERTLIYESYEWEHPLYLALDSVHDNEPARPDSRIAGGHSGELMLDKGDALEWECEIANDDLDFPLRFANKAHEAEMCILRGTYAPSLGRSWSTYVF